MIRRTSGTGWFDIYELSKVFRLRSMEEVISEREITL